MKNYSRNLKTVKKILFIIKTPPKGVLLDVYLTLFLDLGTFYSYVVIHILATNFLVL
jgi:hypothetical protein